jgi:hypothetical protein
MELAAGGERPTYGVIVEKAGSRWFIRVPTVPGALASVWEHDHIEPIVRLAIASQIGLPDNSFDIEISESES